MWTIKIIEKNSSGQVKFTEWHEFKSRDDAYSFAEQFENKVPDREMKKGVKYYEHKFDPTQICV